MRGVTILLLALAAAGGSVAEAVEPVAARIDVGCDENAQVADPVTPSRYYRLLFGRVALPRFVSVPRPPRRDNGPYPFWMKTPILIRWGAGPVDVVVPRAWRERVAVRWGYPHPTAWAARFVRCPLPKVGKPWSQWIAYAGGVYLRESACVPLIVRVGDRSTTARLSIGRRCS